MFRMTTVWRLGMVVTGARAASAQTMQRFEVGPVLRVDRVTEAQAVSVMPVLGIVGSARLATFWRIEGEITQADRHEFGFNREGISETFAPPNAEARFQTEAILNCSVTSYRYDEAAGRLVLGEAGRTFWR